MFRQIGWMELLLILGIILLLFGATKLPQLAGSIGKAIREFRQNLASEQGETDEQSGVQDKKE